MACEISIRNQRLLCEISVLVPGLLVFLYYGIMLGWVICLLLSRWVNNGFALYDSHVLYLATVVGLALCIAILACVILFATVWALHVIRRYARLWGAKIKCGDYDIIFEAGHRRIGIHFSDIATLSTTGGAVNIRYFSGRRAERIWLPARAFRAGEFENLRANLDRLWSLCDKGKK